MGLSHRSQLYANIAPGPAPAAFNKNKADVLLQAVSNLDAAWVAGLTVDQLANLTDMQTVFSAIYASANPDYSFGGGIVSAGSTDAELASYQADPDYQDQLRVGNV